MREIISSGWSGSSMAGRAAPKASRAQSELRLKRTAPKAKRDGIPLLRGFAD